MHGRRRRGLAGSPVLENEKAVRGLQPLTAEVVPSVFGLAPGGSYCTAFGEISSTLFPKKGKEQYSHGAIRTRNPTKTMTMAEETTQSAEEMEDSSMLAFRIQHRLLPVSQHSNHMLVQADPDCLYLHFFQIRPPVVLGTSEDGTAVTADGKEATAIAEPLASISVNVSKMQRFIDVLQEQLNKLNERSNDTDPGN